MMHPRDMYVVGEISHISPICKTYKFIQYRVVLVGMTLNQHKTCLVGFWAIGHCSLLHLKQGFSSDNTFVKVKKLCFHSISKQDDDDVRLC